MNRTAVSAPDTLVGALALSIEAMQRSPTDVEGPVAILWTDADRQWQSLIPALMRVMPQLYACGDYDASRRVGPVIWLKCIVDRSLPEAPPTNVVPVIYLSGIGRQELRAGGDCPRYLQPLIELQYRGAVWHQRNGRDWTVDAFLGSEFGCGLDLAGDTRTRDALLRALPLLASEPLAALRGRRLEADDFDRLAIGDSIRDLLIWMSEPKSFESGSEPARWQTFRDICRRDFNFDPEKDGPRAAGDALLNSANRRSGKWEETWRRFAEAPTLYPGVSACLRMAQPDDLLVDRSRQPAENESDEDNLRRELTRVCDLSHAAACEKIVNLEEIHASRRQWVWTRLGESPLAVALLSLAQLAEYARKPLGGTSVRAIAEEYAAQGWRCDRAAVLALSSRLSSADGKLIEKVMRTIYEPWLDRSARHFQQLFAQSDTAQLVGNVSAERDTCVLFADGLRFDVGALLQERLESRGFQTRLSYRIAPTPTVTATAKSVASPAKLSFVGSDAGEDFAPVLASTRQPCTAARLRSELTRLKVEVLEEGDLRFASAAEGGGWSEVGRLDEDGHSLGARLVGHIEAELETISERIAALLNAGWQKVRVVTDHGWLLLPGGLPKIELPKSLTQTKWARCATVKGESSPEVPTYPWYWNPYVRIASPPGIGSFIVNTEYAHGGVSAQECVIPELIVESGEQRAQPKITAITWRGMRCKVAAAPYHGGLQVDLRLNYRQASTSIAASPKELSLQGEASLACEDDTHERHAATVVLLDSAGHVVDYKPTTVGDDE